MTTSSSVVNACKYESISDLNIDKTPKNSFDFLLKNNISVAIASGGSAKLVERYLQQTYCGYSRVFVISNLTFIKSKNATQKELLINSAKIATEFNHTDYGIAISEPYYSFKDNKVHCLGCITDFNNTTFIEGVADAGIDSLSIVSSVTNSVIKKLGKIVLQKIKDKECRKAKKQLLPIKIAISSCGVGIVACVAKIIFLIL